MLNKSLAGIIASFGHNILKSSIQNRNEIYLEIDPDRVPSVCTHLYNDLRYPLVSMFACDERKLEGKFTVYYVFADRENGKLVILKTAVDPHKMEIRSLSGKVYAAARYEREIKDLFGMIPVGHHNPKRLVMHSNWPQGEFPLRKDYNTENQPPFASETIKFQKVRGEGVFEIPVGPVHAGIIEPGHFRFSVAGEPIINLEAQLYYTHKGIEKLCEGNSVEKCLYIAERISGDETIANSLAYCQAIEKIGGIQVPVRATYTRVVFAELERLISHLGDLGGLCLDTGYGFANSQFRMLKGWGYNIADELCGMRFLRSVNRIGGVRMDFLQGKESCVIGMLDKLRSELTDTVRIIKSNSMFIDRVENTGILKTRTAEDLNAVGPGGRASGVGHDVRKDFPYEAYGELRFKVPVYYYGDVNCRMNIKIDECFQSIEMMKAAIESMPPGKISEHTEKLEPYRYAFGMTEAPRGENIHFVMTGENDTIFRYKIRTPSFCNWPALCFAVKGNIVPDFPLINKSFNLSYAGNDL